MTMRTKHVGVWVLSLALGGLLAGCQTAQDRARFQDKPTIETYPVTLVSIDDVPAEAGRTPMNPGLRRVTVQMPVAAGFKPGETRTIDLNVKSCSSYWLVAVRDLRAGPDFQVKVDYEKRDYNCALPFGLIGGKY